MGVESLASVASGLGRFFPVYAFHLHKCVEHLQVGRGKKYF